MEEIYTELAKELVEKVRKCNPGAQVIKNWNKSPGIVIRLIKSYHLNIGEDFLEEPFRYLQSVDFK